MPAQISPVILEGSFGQLIRVGNFMNGSIADTELVEPVIPVRELVKVDLIGSPEFKLLNVSLSERRVDMITMNNDPAQFNHLLEVDGHRKTTTTRVGQPAVTAGIHDVIPQGSRSSSRQVGDIVVRDTGSEIHIGLGDHGLEVRAGGIVNGIRNIAPFVLESQCEIIFPGFKTTERLF